MKLEIALCVLLAGCTAQADVERRVVEHLNDPESARFGEITERNGVTCGTVNAKNAFGGYVGEQGFMIRDDKLYLPMKPMCCTFRQLDTLGEGARQILRECDAAMPPPR